MTTKKKREKLIINTKMWLHREGAAPSLLLRTLDGKRCCLGIYLQDNCGVSPDFLRGVLSPGLLPESVALPDWMIIEDINFTLVEKMMTVNDDANLTEEEVRAQIMQLFAEADIDVEYVDNEPSGTTLP